MYRSIIQKDIGSSLQLLAQLFKAFNHHLGVNPSLNNRRKQGIMPWKKSSNIESFVVR